jgi:2-keto-4-pentenoate hydratase/2-oxohepta-3-ene-1,7-dioic acid hydratase in catechol pathway
MKLVSYDARSVGTVIDDEVHNLDGLLAQHGFRLGTWSRMRYLVTYWAELSATVRDHRDPSPVPLAECILDAPVPDPSKVIAAPINYVDHLAEMAVTATVSDLGIFLKAPSSLIGHGDTIELPYGDRRFDQEGELALIIGRTAEYVAVEDALDYVFGYAGLLDITMRGGEDRSTRKSFDTFTPMGPWVVTADEFGSPSDVSLVCAVSGGVRQEVSTKDLIWGVPELISYTSSVMTLYPGDVITTGTPAGVGPLAAGDTVDLELSGIGRLSVVVASSFPTASPTNGAGNGPEPPPPAILRML